MSHLLLSRRFWPLFVTMFIGAFNDNLFRTALITLITYRLAPQLGALAPLLVTLAIGLFMLPFFLCSATAGQLADKYNKARLIQIVKGAEIGIVLIVVAGFWWQHVGVLLFGLFLTGIQSAFFGPLKYSILPDHLGKEELIAANGWVGAGTFLAILTGNITGGVAMGLEQAALEITIAIMLSIAVLGFLSTLLIPPTAPAAPGLRVTPQFWLEIYRTVSSVRASPVLFRAILMISWFWLVGGMFLSQLPAFTKDFLHAGPTVLTLLLTVFSVSIGVGSVLCNRLLKGAITLKYVPYAALLMTFCIAGFAWLGTWLPPGTGEWQGIGDLLANGLHGWLLLGLLGGTAMAGGLYIVPLYAILQTRADPDSRSRVIAANNILNALFMVISTLVAMILLKYGISLPGMFALVAVGTAVVTWSSKRYCATDAL